MKIVILTVTPVTVEYYGSLVVPDTWNPKLEDTGSQEYQLFVTQLSNGVSRFQPFHWEKLSLPRVMNSGFWGRIFILPIRKLGPKI